MWWYKSLKLYLISTSLNFISHEFKSWNRILSDPRRVTFNSTTITIRLRLCSQTPKSSFVYTNIICEVRMSHFAVKPFDMKSAVTHNTSLIFITCKIKYFYPFIHLSTKIPLPNTLITLWNYDSKIRFFFVYLISAVVFSCTTRSVGKISWILSTLVSCLYDMSKISFRGCQSTLLIYANLSWE